jgi:hypothetical protein
MRVKYEKCSLGRAEDIIIEGKLVPQTRKEGTPPPAVRRLREMGEDGLLKWQDARPGAKGGAAEDEGRGERSSDGH